MPSNIRIRGGKFNTIEGNYTLKDNSVAYSAHDNCEDDEMGRMPSTSADGERQEHHHDYTRPLPQFQSMPHQTFSKFSESSRVDNRHSFNIENTQIYNVFNDNSEDHYLGTAPGPPDNCEDDEMGGMPYTTADSQRREDYTRPPHYQPQFQSTPHQPFSASSRVDNRDSFNIRNTRMDNVFNDNSQTHYFRPAPPANQRVWPQNQTPKLPQLIGNSGLPQSIQEIDQRFRQAFWNRSLSEGDALPNTMPGNNDDDESGDNNDSNKPPLLSTSSSEPIYTTYKGKLTKYDNSIRETNISSDNTEGNLNRNSFNDDLKISVGKPKPTKRWFPPENE